MLSLSLASITFKQSKNERTCVTTNNTKAMVLYLIKGNIYRSEDRMTNYINENFTYR